MRHYFVRHQPSQRIRRFYVVELGPTLFGETALTLEWGRSGQAGTLRTRTYADPRAAEQAAAQLVRRRLQRGYRQKSSAEPVGARTRKAAKRVATGADSPYGRPLLATSRAFWPRTVLPGCLLAAAGVLRGQGPLPLRATSAGRLT
jgi:predicted DNA-binding WGR domain protein